ncbi:GNAT family N-acetyltransferase [Trujillonella humicola]|uniref:GNAT family N-acetyltransferase n=1 Tax=Trujillonella humicola TaxID=3383699 RepID=UPI003906681B
MTRTTPPAASAASPAAPVVEPATAADFDDIRRLTVGVYRDEELASPVYLGELGDVEGRAARALLLVARRGGAGAGGSPGSGVTGIVGSVALVLDGDFGEITADDSEAAFRMLVVDPAARGAGIGELLVRECLARARAAGKTTMVLSTDPRMRAAHRLYERLGFRRLPERDWSPVPGVDLRVYALPL